MHFKNHRLVKVRNSKIIGRNPEGIRAVFGSGLRVLFCLLLLVAISNGWAKPASKTKVAKADSSAFFLFDSPWVDSTRIRHLYMDGEFEAAITILETNLKESRQYSHDDSVFIFKHLGVMYAAQYETREKGKYYMHRLLEVEPTAKILDMYASDMIYMIFKNIQEEYEQKKMIVGTQSNKADKNDALSKVGRIDTLGNEASHLSGQSYKPSGSDNKWIWAGIAAGTVAVGIGAYMLLSDVSRTPNKAVEF